MGHVLRDLMTRDPVILDARAPVTEAARQMRDRDVGDVLVQRDGKLCGIVTDRDLVVRCLASDRNPRAQTLHDVCSIDVVSLEAGASIDDAIRLMRKREIRRLPVLESGSPAGIVSLGDLARAREPESLLGRISAGRATR